MRISISRREALVRLAAAGVVPPGSGRAEVVTRLETVTKGDKIVALTFDACETRTPAFLDTAISDFLIGRRIPFTVFACGRFARHNQDALAALSRLEFVEIENHSMNHDNHMERMDQATVRREVADAETMLKGITGKRTRYFRFPAGNYDDASLAAVEGMGYRVVHWSFASGDPMKSLTPRPRPPGCWRKPAPAAFSSSTSTGAAGRLARRCPASSMRCNRAATASRV